MFSPDRTCVRFPASPLASAKLTLSVQCEALFTSRSWLSPHVLTHVFFSACSLTCSASARFLTCCMWSGSPQHHSEEDSSPSRHCAWRSVVPELGCSGTVQSLVGHLVVGMAVDSALPRVVHFSASLGVPRRRSPLPRRSVPRTAICTSRWALLCSASRGRALGCSGTSCFRFGLRGRLQPKL